MSTRDVVFPAGRQALYDHHRYSAAVRSDGFLFVSGTVGSREDGSPEPDFAKQVKLAFANLKAVLAAAGASFDDVVDVTSFHTDPATQFETVMAVRELMTHPAFDIKNPNRVRALIGAFSVNHLRFHGADGAGYALVGEVIRQLDPINPQIAARLAGGFESWRRYDERRQALMRAELEKIRALSGISPNLFEIVSKMLG